MILRSMLFIPADSEKKLSKADSVVADALIFDLEDSVAAPRKQVGRDMAKEFMSSRARADRKTKYYVRINPLESDAPLRDLAGIMAGKPDGIMVPKASGPQDIDLISKYLDILEIEHGTEASSTKIVAITGESSAGILSLGQYVKADLPRLVGMSWGPWDLAADVGAANNRHEDGSYEFTYQMAMSLSLLGAKAAGVQAIDTAFTEFKDSEGLLKWCKMIRREGWTGKVAIHPAQVPIIHEGFRPSDEEVTHAQRVIDAFANENEGVATLDGVMLDLPHLKQARYILALRDAG
ncbi:MAG: CoA ester lyase [Candidatus Marinimicrobia bacterium]|nr:CoA ester lyase [Candidatus Neomarinimicrobiota bacterium]